MSSSDRDVRRSTRTLKTTTRAKSFFQSNEGDRFRFPCELDQIRVKWSLDGTIVWWPASVTFIDRNNTSTQQCRGKLKYHKRGNYKAEESTVLFLFSKSNGRYVSNVEKSEAASWFYEDEMQDDGDYDQLSNSSGSTDIGGASTQTRAPVQSKRNSKPKRSATDKTVSDPSVKRQKQVHEPEAAGPSSHAVQHDNVEGTKAGALTGHSNHGVETNYNNTVIANVSNSDKDDLHTRLRLIEQKLRIPSHVNPGEGPPRSSYSNQSYSLDSVIVSLRWSLLKALEKPLKVLNLPDLAKHGIACNEMSVTTQCDYYTFRNISRTLFDEHQCAGDDNYHSGGRKSRIAFSPSYNTTQSGSSAADNMNIVFSCLADVTSLLRIRDDNDFEAILAKELLNDSSTLLRIVGTFTITDEDDDCNMPPKQSTTTSNNSISATSEVTSTMRLFIGSAPVEFAAESEVEGNSSSTPTNRDRMLPTSIIQQECKHFCSLQNCYRRPWSIKNVYSTFSVRCMSDLDGTIPKEQLRNHFILNWSRQSAPSTIKWTRDIQDAGNNCPGQLRLTIPFIFSSSNRNVRRLVLILDNHIETFMRFRSTLHTMSSFK